MRLERRFSSMTQQYNPAYKKNLVKLKVLNVWFYRYLKENRLEFTKSLSHYIEMVAEWETKVMTGRAFYAFGIILALLGGLAQFLVYFSDVTHKMDYRMYSGAMITLSLSALYFGFKVSARTKMNKPLPAMIQLVREYRKILSAADTTVLWNEWIYRSGSSETGDQLADLEKVDADHPRLPQFLVEAAESKLYALGKQISELEGRCKGGDAADIRNGIFTTCFDEAVTFGVILDSSGFGKFIPNPVL